MIYTAKYPYTPSGTVFRYIYGIYTAKYPPKYEYRLAPYLNTAPAKIRICGIYGIHTGYFPTMTYIYTYKYVLIWTVGNESANLTTSRSRSRNLSPKPPFLTRDAHA